MQLFMLVMTDVIVILLVSTDVVNRCYCHVNVMAVNAIVTDIIVTFLLLWLIEMTY